MRPETRHSIVNTVMVTAAFALVMAIILMRPAARVAKPDVTAQSAALSAAHASASR